jgi:hypothetical protein
MKKKSPKIKVRKRVSTRLTVTREHKTGKEYNRKDKTWRHEP